ncbi:hypothetical protein T439DRAFT_327768 [Meredithblackwellia eburnea MCA 4105]
MNREVRWAGEVVLVLALVWGRLTRNLMLEGKDEGFWMRERWMPFGRWEIRLEWRQLRLGLACRTRYRTQALSSTPIEIARLKR